MGDGKFQPFQGTGLGRAEVVFDLRPGLLDGVEVGRVGRQVQQLRSHRLDQPRTPDGDVFLAYVEQVTVSALAARAGGRDG